MAIRPKHVLLAVGMTFVVIGHLGDGTSTREATFWLGVVLSFVGQIHLADARKAGTPKGTRPFV